MKKSDIKIGDQEYLLDFGSFQGHPVLVRVLEVGIPSIDDYNGRESKRLDGARVVLTTPKVRDEETLFAWSGRDRSFSMLPGYELVVRTAQIVRESSKDDREKFDREALDRAQESELRAALPGVDMKFKTGYDRRGATVTMAAADLIEALRLEELC